jgi:hypothetical protein
VFLGINIYIYKRILTHNALNVTVTTNRDPTKGKYKLEDRAVICLCRNSAVYHVSSILIFFKMSSYFLSVVYSHTCTLI